MDSKIWNKLEKECKIHCELGNIQKECDRAIELMKTVRDTFPTYTLHDERHICNVISLMEQILNDSEVEKLSVGECAMLILVACYHDVGMCYTEEQRKNELKSARFLQYLEKNPKIYLQVEKNKEVNKEISEEIQLEYFRKIHHLRVSELLSENWEINFVRKDRLIEICRSHGESIEDAICKLHYDKSQETDYVLCAILLRLSDILDFDSSRAPDVLYKFQKINTAKDPMANVEWQKHMSSRGFKFIGDKERVLTYSAVCENMQDEYEISKFLDYIDYELDTCRVKLEEYGQEKWRTLQITTKIDRNIERQGYQTGEYCITLEADNVLQLLVGNDLYESDLTFIRELMQNSLDAVRARKMVDRRWKYREENQIILSSWIDQDGFQWFKIDDCGIGMTEQMIINFFLRAGKSYYQSDEFKKISYDNRKYYDFLPISQFGIGILSCFLKGDRMEISTRHYKDGKGIRFTMNGIKGYYSIAEEEKGDKGTPMPSVSLDGSESFRQTAGTSIAIRIKETLSENIMNCVKTYLCYPNVSVCYKDSFELIMFPTEQDLMNFVKKTREIRVPFPLETMKKIEEMLPEITWEESPYICLKCVPLDETSESKFISGADFEMVIRGKHNGTQEIIIDEFKIVREVITSLIVTKNNIEISLFYKFSCYKGNDLIELAELWSEYKEKSELAKLCAEKLENKEGLGDILDEERKIDAEKFIRDLKYILELISMDKIRVVESIPFSINSDLEIAMTRFILPRCVSGIKNIDNHKIEKVYNGICVEVTWEDYQLVEDRNFRYTVMLLSQRFQPKLGISRESVRYFPVEAAGYIELLAKKIGNVGLSCIYPSYYGKMEFRKFYDLTNDPKFCILAENILEANWKESIKDIKEKLRQAEGKIEIRVASFDDVLRNYFGDYSFYFLRILLRLFIQKEFEVHWDFNKNNVMEFFVTGIRKEEVSETEQILLPMTFVKSLQKNTKILTEDDIMMRVALNADHPFSVWFLKYAEFLYQNHMSLFKKMREKICELDSIHMISEINMLLKEIEKRLNISIPDDVWLKESDFIKIW
jgi:hypothetical protein